MKFNYPQSLNLAAQNGVVIAYKFKGTRFDCGSVKGYVEAIKYFYEREFGDGKK